MCRPVGIVLSAGSCARWHGAGDQIRSGWDSYHQIINATLADYQIITRKSDYLFLRFNHTALGRQKHPRVGGPEHKRTLRTSKNKNAKDWGQVFPSPIIPSNLRCLTDTCLLTVRAYRNGERYRTIPYDDQGSILLSLKSHEYLTMNIFQSLWIYLWILLQCIFYLYSCEY